MRTGSHIGRFVALAVASSILLLPATAFPQAPAAAASSFDQVAARLKVGDTVLVTDASNAVHKGRLRELSATSIVLTEGGAPLRLAEEQVTAVRWQKPDSLWTGALSGLALGVGLGLLAASGEDDDVFMSQGEVAALSAGLLGILGALIGTGVDAAIPPKKVLIYERAQGAARASTLGLSPIVSHRRRGLAVSVAF